MFHSVKFPTVNLSDPRSTADAAISLAGELARLFRRPVPVLLGHSSSDGLAALAERMHGKGVFDRATCAECRSVLAEIEATTDRETGERIDWFPVRCIDGAEEFKPIVRQTRTRHGQALATVGERLSTMLALIERTGALLTAERLIHRRR